MRIYGSDAAPYHYPVFAGERNHIAYRTEGNVFAVFIKYLFGILAVYRAGELKRDPDPGHLFEGARAIRPVGIDDRLALGKSVADFMMIGHDHLHSAFIGVFYLIRRGGSGVNGNYQAHASVSERIYRLSVEPVALGNPVGYISCDIRSPALEKRIKQCRRGHAVGVIISVNTDHLKFIERSVYA